MKDTARAAAEARRQGRQRLHRLVDLAPALLVPAASPTDDRRTASSTWPSAGTRSSTSSRSEGVRFGLEVHPTEIAFDFYSRRDGPRGARPPPRVRLQLRPEPPALADGRPGRLHRASSPTGSTTSTSRTPRGRSTASRHPRLAPELRRPAPRLGLPLARAAARSTSRRSPARSTRSATTARSRSSGKTGMDREYGAQEAFAFVRRPTSRRRRTAFDRRSRSG